MIEVLHWTVVGVFAVQLAYAGWMVLFGVVPGVWGPLFRRAAAVPHELLVTRRLYALEFWIAFAGLAVYLGITEVATALHGG